MFFMLKTDGFIRKIGPYGYIFNQTTKHDRVFNQSGGIFLLEIQRFPRTVDEAVESLSQIFSQTNRQILKTDFIDFLNYLEKNQFIITDASFENLMQKDKGFTYEIDNPKTFSFDFRQKSQEKLPDTQDYLGDFLKQNPFIFSFQIELTSRCNERCLHCYIPHENKLFDMDTHFAFHVIDQVSEMGCVQLTLSGGGITLFPDLPKIIEYARKKDLSVTLLSNLVEVSDDLLEVMKKSHLNLVQVSVYSLKPEEHDQITCLPGSLQKTLKNIEKLIAANIPVQVSCPVMKINYQSYKDVLQWAYKHKIKAYTDFIMMARTDQSSENLKERINLQETKELLQDIIAVDKDYKIMVSELPETKLFMNQTEEPVCGVGRDTLCMTADGNCYPCAGWQGYQVGNLKTTSLKEIWEKSPQLNYLRSIKRGQFLQCLNCPDQNFCAMCMVRNYNETGDIFSIPQHFCDMARINREVVEESYGK